MQVNQFKKHFKAALADGYPSSEVDTFFNRLLENTVGLSRLELALNPTLELSDHQRKEFELALKRLKQHEPIQYIIGKTEFYGLDFRVNENVLIPRPETEELVNWIVKEVQSTAVNPAMRILDIGTGSGCIAISLAKNLPEAEVSALDVSKEALQLAAVNARKNQVGIDFHRVDILQPDPLYEKFDLIVSNPPYVRNLEKKQMASNVLDYEPHLALFVDDEDALLFYRQILTFAHTHLKERGELFFELNEYLKTKLEQLFKKENYTDPIFKKDIYEKYRMVKLKKN